MSYYAQIALTFRIIEHNLSFTIIAAFDSIKLSSRGATKDLYLSFGGSSPQCAKEGNFRIADQNEAADAADTTTRAKTTLLVVSGPALMRIAQTPRNLKCSTACRSLMQRGAYGARRSDSG